VVFEGCRWVSVSPQQPLGGDEDEQEEMLDERGGVSGPTIVIWLPSSGTDASTGDKGNVGHGFDGFAEDWADFVTGEFPVLVVNTVAISALAGRNAVDVGDDRYCLMSRSAKPKVFSNSFNLAFSSATWRAACWTAVVTLTPSNSYWRRRVSREAM